MVCWLKSPIYLKNRIYHTYATNFMVNSRKFKREKKRKKYKLAHLQENRTFWILTGNCVDLEVWKIVFSYVLYKLFERFETAMFIFGQNRFHFFIEQTAPQYPKVNIFRTVAISSLKLAWVNISFDTIRFRLYRLMWFA